MEKAVMRVHKITVVTVDDEPVFRQGLFVLFNHYTTDIEVIGEAGNGREGVRVVSDKCPDVVLMDIAMPELNGVDAAKIIMRDCPRSKVIFLSRLSDPSYVTPILETGAAGYLVKGRSGIREIASAVRQVSAGESVLDPGITHHLLQSCRRQLGQGMAIRVNGEQLTSREREVLQLIAEGKANKQIADVMGISIKTVEKHRQQVMNKLNIHNISGLTRYAITHGVIHLGSQDDVN